MTQTSKSHEINEHLRNLLEQKMLNNQHLKNCEIEIHIETWRAVEHGISQMFLQNDWKKFFLLDYNYPVFRKNVIMFNYGVGIAGYITNKY